MTVMLDAIIGSGRLRFSADVASVQIQLPGWPIACPSHWECRLHWIVMSSCSSLRKLGRNISSFRNADHFGFGDQSARRRCTTFSRSSSGPSSIRATTGYPGLVAAQRHLTRAAAKPRASVTTRGCAPPARPQSLIADSTKQCRQSRYAKSPVPSKLGRLRARNQRSSSRGYG